MKKKNIVIILIIIILILLSLIIYFSHINEYSDNYFKISYDPGWTKQEGDNFILNNKNGSSIEIYTKIDIDNNDKNDIYLDLNNSFLEKYDEYKLINYSETKVGKNYYDGYELLYESNKMQLLYMIVIKGNRIINIKYSSSIDNFDLDLNSFYNVINSMEVR